VFAVDTNILVYAHRPESDLHPEAVTLLRELANSRATWAIPWPCVHEFYGIVTKAGVFRPPSSIDDALRQIDAWLASPSLVLLTEAPDHLTILRGLLRRSRVVGSKAPDARIAAICLSHGVHELITMDRDFARFPQLRTRSLLA
jgi:toxin-antitoxin system PIN domain toxin